MASRALRKEAAVASIRTRLADDGWRMFGDDDRIHTNVETPAGAIAARQPDVADCRVTAISDEVDDA